MDAKMDGQMGGQLLNMKTVYPTPNKVSFVGQFFSWLQIVFFSDNLLPEKAIL